MKFKIFSKGLFVFMNILFLPFIFLSADSDEGFPSRDILDTLSLGLNDTVGISMYPGDIIMEVFQAPADLTLIKLELILVNGILMGKHQSLKLKYSSKIQPVIHIVLMVLIIRLSNQVKAVGLAMLILAQMSHQLSQTLVPKIRKI